MVEIDPKSTAQAVDTDDVPECNCIRASGATSSHNVALAAMDSQDGDTWLHPKMTAEGKRPEGADRSGECAMGRNIAICESVEASQLLWQAEAVHLCKS